MDNSSSSFENVFTHEPLPDAANYIRLLEVLDDNYSETIKVRCKLTIWPIDSVPSYRAISYTWGDPESNTFILMNEKTLQVRTNCEFALKQAYWYKKKRSKWPRKSWYYWVDAICIDQTNLGEKGKQVSMMGSIYKKASHVLACIGDHADDSLFFFQKLYGLKRHVVRVKDIAGWRDHLCSHPGSISTRFRLVHRFSTTNRFVLALARLAMRPYFSRLWILQELQNAQNMTILCGQFVLRKEDARSLFREMYECCSTDHDLSLSKDDYFSRTPWGCYTKYLDVKFLRRMVNHGLPHPLRHGEWLHDVPRRCITIFDMMRTTALHSDHDLFVLLETIVCRLQCAVPRDKVYGIISLIEWGDVAPPTPDYAQSDLNVAVDFLEAVMKLWKTRADYAHSQIWRYLVITTRMLNLDTESQSLSDALKARRSPPKDCALSAAKPRFEDSIIRLPAPGWRLLSEDIDNSSSKLRNLRLPPPDYRDDCLLLLPRWARAGDWVIEVGSESYKDLWYKTHDLRHIRPPTYTAVLIMREGTDGHCNTFIGYGFYATMDPSSYPCFKRAFETHVDIYLDIEDGMIFLLRMKQLHELEMDSDSTDWVVDFLDTGVCKPQTPGSSYAILSPEAKLPVETVIVDPWSELKMPEQGNYTLYSLKSFFFVLWDTKYRRGWLVNGHVAALHLLRAYLKNISQAKDFDFSRLDHSLYSPSAAHELLSDRDYMKTPLPRVVKAVKEKSEHGEPSNDQAGVDKKLLGEVLNGFYGILLKMAESTEAMDANGRLSDCFHKFKRTRKDVSVNGWDFQRIYCGNKAEVCVNKFDKEPVWLSFVRGSLGSSRSGAAFLFGSNFGEIMKSDDSHCCPYFESLPAGQDYLAVSMHTIYWLVEKGSSHDKPEESAARLQHIGEIAWKRHLSPFHHAHGQVFRCSWTPWSYPEFNWSGSNNFGHNLCRDDTGAKRSWVEGQSPAEVATGLGWKIESNHQNTYCNSIGRQNTGTQSRKQEE
ncbi:hypothetical protein J7T55_009870 [Diaporthe amygdali]|uniref:uncharacterized protein n=1 Tax=Phomopsis amygdali TaxID=1214568 RepID=UPI0022FE4B16|nr:uncharacterized protein J7T55_009870 [Diaporthe amygdali]KAJ0116720.1 hypothetical protein J7T55_009870 [Diaporthe amygdali]